MLGPLLEFVGPTDVIWEGQRYTFFGGNDYHRFSFDPDILKAVHEATDRWGINTAGSRLTTANHPLYLELEEKVARYLGAEKAIVFSAGYMSNAILLQAVGDLYTDFVLDEIAHSSLTEAVTPLGKPIHRFKHVDPDDLKRVIAHLPPGSKPLILTDGVFPSSGVIPPLAEYAKLGIKILIDDAHGMGVVGPTGKGSWEECGIPRESFYQTGTLSKGLGGFGGVIAGDDSTIERVIRRSGAFTGSTPMPLPVTVAAIRAIEILTEKPQKVDRLRSVSVSVKHSLRELGFRTSLGSAPICSVTFLDEAKNALLGRRLKENGIYPVFINYPGCPPGGHFRFTLSSAHTDAQIEHLLGTIAQSVKELS